MVNKSFRALVIEEKDGKFIRYIKSRTIDDLPQNELLVHVHYSSLNYKDALSVNGNKGVTKTYPHTPGIDAAGIVVSSKSNAFKTGDKVIVTGFDLGMNTDGGFGQYICVSAKWVVLLPPGLTLKEAMILGTAGITAGIAVEKLTAQLKPEDGEIAISGATGGVGSLSISILSQLGYDVAAITGKFQEDKFLVNSGAKRIIYREEFLNINDVPLLSAQFAGGIDCVGGHILENIIKSTKATGVVACCGNVSSPQLNLTVYPFILRGISLIGVASQNYPMKLRAKIWENLSNIWKPLNLHDMAQEIGLDEIGDAVDKMMSGKIRGRIIINLNN